jgi:hypothetical protein
MDNDKERDCRGMIMDNGGIGRDGHVCPGFVQVVETDYAQ